MKPDEISALNLAYMGDAVYSEMVRKYLVLSGDYPVGVLTKKAISYVSAKEQAAVMHAMLDDGFLTEEELQVYHRGRNAHPNSTAKHTDPVTYRVATGFESVIGWLFLSGKEERLNEIWDYIGTKRGG